MFEQSLNDSYLIEYIIAKQKKCAHPTNARELLNGIQVCTKCAKDMTDEK